MDATVVNGLFSDLSLFLTGGGEWKEPQRFSPANAFFSNAQGQRQPNEISDLGLTVSANRRNGTPLAKGLSGVAADICPSLASLESLLPRPMHRPDSEKGKYDNQESRNVVAKFFKFARDEQTVEETLSGLVPELLRLLKLRSFSQPDDVLRTIRQALPPGPRATLIMIQIACLKEDLKPADFLQNQSIDSLAEAHRETMRFLRSELLEQSKLNPSDTSVVEPLNYEPRPLSKHRTALLKKVIEAESGGHAQAIKDFIKETEDLKKSDKEILEQQAVILGKGAPLDQFFQLLKDRGLAVLAQSEIVLLGINRNSLGFFIQKNPFNEVKSIKGLQEYFQKMVPLGIPNEEKQAVFKAVRRELPDELKVTLACMQESWILHGQVPFDQAVRTDLSTFARAHDLVQSFFPTLLKGLETGKKD